MSDIKNKAGTPEDNNKDYPGYPSYPKGEDIYNHDIRDETIDPESGKIEEPVGTRKSSTDSDEEELDIPGAELDDADEEIGREDEENNYYSIGGDNHNNLEEDNQATGID